MSTKIAPEHIRYLSYVRRAGSELTLNQSLFVKKPLAGNPAFFLYRALMHGTSVSEGINTPSVKTVPLVESGSVKGR